MEKIYRYYEDFGRAGYLEGVFVATQTEINEAPDDVYFGEVLGKHSEVYTDEWKQHITVLTDDQEFISKALFYGLCGTGYNPLDYFDDFYEGFDDD